MLYRPEEFEPLVEERWNEERIRAGIREIVENVQEALRGRALLWPAEEWDRWRATSPLKNLYNGAAGVLWALADLRDRGHAEPQVALDALALGALERYRARPDFARFSGLPQPSESSFLCGETGILLTAYRLAPSGGLADALHHRVRENAGNEANELMWGSPGTLVAARLMLDWTGDSRWREAWNESADALLARRGADGVWTQRLYGYVERSLGPAHGLVGNVLALGQLLDNDRLAALLAETEEVLVRSAVVEGGLVNWPPSAGGQLENKRGQIRLQWCHGAAGIVASAFDYLEEELVLGGAELVWRAGAHGDERGSSLCHGTAGNGYALLKAFARTRDDRWLERARAFAVHALAQMRRLRASRGTGRYSLWTGDLGVALFLADCVDAQTAYPVLEAD